MTQSPGASRVTELPDTVQIDGVVVVKVIVKLEVVVTFEKDLLSPTVPLAVVPKLVWLMV